MRRRRLALAAAAMLAGCATVNMYEGPRRAAAEIALIRGDPRVSAGLPLAAVIRKLDARAAGLAETRFALEPGRHELLVDCLVAAARTTTRFELTVEVQAGGRYALVADAAPGNQRCGAVRLVAR